MAFLRRWLGPISGLLLLIGLTLPALALNSGDRCTTPSSCLRPNLTCNQVTFRCMPKISFGMPISLKDQRSVQAIATIMEQAVL